MEPQGKGVGGPAEVAVEEGVLQDLMVQQDADSGIVVVPDFPEGIAAVAVKELFVNGIYRVLPNNNF